MSFFYYSKYSKLDFKIIRYVCKDKTKKGDNIMLNATYENLSENLSIINKRANDHAEQFLEISPYDPLTNMFELTEKYLRTDYDVSEHQAESFELLDLKQEVLEIMENIRKDIEMKIVSMLNPDAPCTPKQELPDIIDQLQTSFADTYFKLMYLQQVFKLERDTLVLNKATDSSEKYANELESKIADGEFALCIDKINDYIESKYDQQKIKRVLDRLDNILPKYNSEHYERKISIDYTSDNPRSGTYLVASLLNKETNDKCDVIYLAEIMTSSTNILFINKFQDNVLMEEVNKLNIGTYLSLINKFDDDSLKEEFIDRLLQLTLKISE